MAQASFARNDVPYAGAGTLLHTTPTSSHLHLLLLDLQCHFHCQKYYIIDNYNCVFIKFTCRLFENIDFVTPQIKQNTPGGGGGVYLHTTPTSSEW